MSPLLKQLLLNILNAYNDRLADDGCNDLSFDDPLLEHLSKDELAKLYKEIAEKNYSDASELSQNFQLVDMASTLVEKL